ncbi:hypothetical protein B5C26_04025 [Photorhabdus luminescens]|uniref:Uncharacterized protein n=1 Tax=Photorhabdus luminescens subsp. mexicana TaxID=2100167 RepID=A0A4R4JGY4_PHOLU|nr:hypothetical protein [Photorhabdus caribbeanensis]OWO84203.1 hypothetical protein B5C26_04025 [Photorhabdus luminescens]TDB53454.1 hypothetical protein C5468_07165 [Photorhabdus luminescens subsp. mexicana]
MNIRKILLIIVALTVTPTAIALNKIEGTIEMLQASNTNGDCLGKIVTPTRAQGFRWVCTYSAGSILLSMLQTAYSSHENVAIAVQGDAEYSPLYKVQLRHKCLSNPAYCNYPSH